MKQGNRRAAGPVAAHAVVQEALFSGKVVMRAVLSLGLAALFLWLLQGRLSDIDMAEVRAAVGTVGPAQWGSALLATALSFWAVGRYDGVLHRHLATGVPQDAARRAGIAAIAVSQTLGLGVVTGALVRWRMLPGLTLWQVTRLTAAVALSFLAGWAVVTALVLLAVPGAPFRALAGGVVLAALALTLLCAIAPRWRGHAIAWPNLFTLSRLVGLAATDTLAAGLALWALCPPELALPLWVLLPAFLISIGAGLVSNTPGGVGAFEMTLLTLLPTTPEAPLLAAVLAWRLVYFALPAVLGALLAVTGPRRRPAPAMARPPQPLGTGQAETLLARQGELRPARIAGGLWVAGRTPHLLVGMFDPVAASGAAAIAGLEAVAEAEGRRAVLYKCTGRVAVAARRAGYRVVPLAREAWLDPRSFRLDTPARAGLRRKLRHATAAGLRITCGTPLPLAEMAEISAEWAATHCGERGFSTGRWQADYVAGQRVYLGWRGAELVAFASFHEGTREWTLDLMRHSATAPDGTMQSLIARALTDAGREGLERLSLAAIPADPDRHLTGLPRKLATRMLQKTTGLARFKAGFDPNWQPLYLAAPDLATLALAGAEIARAIHRPGPLVQSKPSPNFHEDHDDYEFASASVAWQRWLPDRYS